ncbi:MAG: hypothetical protein HY238_17280 [Acidobacteria bacterium]|nr:hypothetical protein [Acidobacteriota bacterium]
MDPQLLRGLIGLLLVCAVVHAQPRARGSRADYFPLAVGSHWVYVQRGAAAGEPIEVEVTKATRLGDNTYYELSGYAGSRALVRQTPAGDVVQYDDAGGAERLWYAFRAAQPWRSQLAIPCIAQAIAARNEPVRVPAGSFPSTLIIQYLPGPCLDAGLVEEAFAPGVGLVKRTETTIAGPRSYELAYAIVNGVAITGPELSFGLSIDRPLYYADFMPPVDPARSLPLLTARLTIRNTSALPLSLLFNSGQQYDLTIRNESGQEVFLWSLGKLFTQGLTRLDLSPGEKTFLIETLLGDRSGKTFPEGRYTVEGWLTTSGAKLYSAGVAFEIKYTF